MSESVLPIVVPRVNVNDDEVRLVEWVARAETQVLPGDVVCTIETSKAEVEVSTEHAGIIVPVVAVDAMIPVGAPLAYVGATLEQVQTAIAALDEARTMVPSASGTPRSTARAGALAREYGIDLATVASGGVKGTIKERDVRRLIEVIGDADADAEPGKPASVGLPDALLSVLEPAVDFSRHELAVIDGLQRSREELILATLDYEIGVGRLDEGIRHRRRAGTMLSLQHVAIAALGRTLPRFSRLITVRAGGRMYTYRKADVAFVVRSQDGRLFTPVVRDPGALDLEEVAKACVRGAMSVNRGEVLPGELEGASFTVSHIGDAGVVRFMALPNRFQSAVLAIAGERPGPSEPTVTMTLTYDHGLCDGSYVAAFLNALCATMDELLT